MDRIEVLRQTELFRDLDKGVLEVLASHAVEKKLGKDELLFVAGETASGLYVVAEGSLRAFRTGIDGREQVIHVEKAITTIAEVPVFDGGNYPSTVAAEEPSRVYFIRRDDIIRTCISHPQLALAATKLLAMRLRKCAELVETLSLREVGQRVAEFLLHEAESLGKETPEGTVFRLSMTHNQLAARVGTVREVVSRAILRLQTQNLIRTNGKEINIPRIDALRRYIDSE